MDEGAVKIPLPLSALRIIRLLRVAKLLKAGRVIEAYSTQKERVHLFFDVRLYNGDVLRRVPRAQLTALDAKARAIPFCFV